MAAINGLDEKPWYVVFTRKQPRIKGRRFRLLDLTVVPEAVERSSPADRGFRRLAPTGRVTMRLTAERWDVPAPAGLRARK